MLDYPRQQARLRLLAAQLLTEGRVQVVLGLQENEEAGQPTPVFVRQPADCDRLVWNRHCALQLAAYLPALQGQTVAVAAKACDLRAIVNLLAEKQLQRQELVLISLECAGMYKDGQTEPAAGCGYCRPAAGAHPDYLIGGDGSDAFIGAALPPAGEQVSQWLAQSSAQERQQRFLVELDRCILCYACRQACPACYCPVCFTDRKANPWEQVDMSYGEKAAFHLTRAIHLAGRCTDCGACQRVCPAGVQLHYLTRGLGEFVAQEYGFVPGEDGDTPTAMAQYRTDDRETGFWGGEDA